MIEEITEVLFENGLIESNDDVARNGALIEASLTYYFDEDEINAARYYANEESNLPEGSTEWTENWYYQFLRDIANDFIEEIVEEIIEDMNIKFKIEQNNIVASDRLNMKNKVIFKAL